MLWLPKYAVNYLHFDDNLKALIAIFYDVGTILGSFVLGFISDLLWGKRIIVSFISLLLAAIGHFFLIIELENWLLFTLIFFLGFLVGGISNIICAPVCADIAKRGQLTSESQIGTVSGIVDGCGSFGASIG